MTTYVFVSNPDPAKGTIRFEPWAHLHQLLYLIMGEDRVVVLKARQIGISWLLAALALWYALFTPNANIIIFSKRQVESVAMKERAKFIWRYLPEWMQQPIGKDNDELLTFPAMESKIQSFPSTPGAGRSETATLAIMDEWAYVEYAREIYTGVLPTVEHTKLVGVSTANGTGGLLPDGSYGNLFADTYWKAKQGKNQFVPVFIPYDVVPGRDEDWWARQKKDMPSYLALQEYPKHEADAFVVSGTCMFDIDALRGMPVMDMVPSLDTPEIYKPYDPLHTYSAGVDTALGVAGGDFNVIQIIDETTGDQAAKFRSRMPVEQFNEIAYELITQYGKPKVIVDELPQGRLLIKYLMDKRYPKYLIYHRTKNVPGWHTTEPNRKQIFQELEIAIRTKALKIHSLNTVEECLAFGYNEVKGRFEALSGHDDEPSSLALAWHQKLAIPPALSGEHFKPQSYISGGEIVDQDDIDWSMTDPFKYLESAPCPTCQGERWVEIREGYHETCDDCSGCGTVLRRKPAPATSGILE
jgi:hypothetical protein